MLRVRAILCASYKGDQERKKIMFERERERERQSERERQRERETERERERESERDKSLKTSDMCQSLNMKSKQSSRLTQ